MIKLTDSMKQTLKACFILVHYEVTTTHQARRNTTFRIPTRILVADWGIKTSLLHTHKMRVWRNEWASVYAGHIPFSVVNPMNSPPQTWIKSYDILGRSTSFYQIDYMVSCVNT